MSHEISNEQARTFNEAARFLPGNHRPAYSTWWRWWRKGIRGVRLQTILIGGRRYTTQKFVEDFIAEVTARANGEQFSTRTPRRRAKNIEAAERELGVKPQQADNGTS